jgi:hypothetical protein
MGGLLLFGCAFSLSASMTNASWFCCLLFEAPICYVLSYCCYGKLFKPTLCLGGFNQLSRTPKDQGW